MKPLCLLLLSLLIVTTISAQRKHSVHQKRGAITYGTASYYAKKFQDRMMAGGDRYDKNKMTCAHNSLPMGTWIKVTNLRNKRSVVVQVTDRLHSNSKRLVDLSGIAALKLGYTGRGLARVKVEILNKKQRHR